MSKIETDEQNEHLIEVVTQLLSERKSKLDLIVGISRECVNYMEPEAVNLFLARMLRSQVSREVLAKQHIALSVMQTSASQYEKRPYEIGMVHTHINVNDTIQRCVQLARESLANTYKWDIDDPRIPRVELSGDLNVHIAYLPAHLEFILLELCKVSMQSTCQRHENSGHSMPPVHILVVGGADKDDMMIRFSDQGGGLHPSKPRKEGHDESHRATLARGPLLLPGVESLREPSSPPASLVWSFHNIGKQLDSMNLKLEATSTANLSQSEVDGAVTPDPTASYPGGDGLMRLSVLNMDSKKGLPMVKLYAELFGGALDFRTLDGYGTDMYLSLPKFGTSMELHE